MTYKLERSGSKLFVRNMNGTNAVNIQVSAGYNDAGERLTQEQCEAIAEAIHYGLGCHSPIGARVDFTPIIDNL